LPGYNFLAQAIGVPLEAQIVMACCIIAEPGNVQGLPMYATALAKVWYTRLWKSSINNMASLPQRGCCGIQHFGR
jgi:hypothetical protein